MLQKIIPNLWFDGNAKEAVEYYVSVFPNSRIASIEYYPNSTEDGLADFQLNLAGKELVISFILDGQSFVAINAGPEFHFTEAISFAVHCEDQQMIDYCWEKLSASPDHEQCGWCKDMFGLSWQVVPANMSVLMSKQGAFGKLMQMKKIVIADL